MKRKLFILFLLFGMISTSYAQEERFKSLFLYNFTKYIEWPVTSQKGDFVIGILNDSEFEPVITKMLAGKKVGSQSIVIKHLSSYSYSEDCQLLFLSNNENGMVNEILQIIKNKNVLLVSESEGMIKKGSGINFVLKEGKLTYEIRKLNIEKYGLKVNNNLMNLGIVK